MRLLRKTAIIIVIITAVVFSSISGITNALLTARFAQLEKQNVDQNVQRTINALSDDLVALERTDNEWASSDAAYQFVQSPQQGQAYIQSNLLDSDLINLRISLVVYFNETNNVVYSEALDSNNLGIRVPQGTLEAIEANPELWNHTTLYSDIEGIMSTPEGLLMVASDPILTSQSLGPIMGALVMGRYINDVEVAYLSGMLRLPLVIQNLTSSQLPTDFQKALSLMSGNETCVQPLSADLVGGYATMNDLSGNPVLILRVELPRDIYSEGQQDIFYLSLALGLVCIVFGSAIMLLMETVVLTPLAGLDKEVRSIRQDPKGSKRLRLKGNDELASLGASVNRMLAALEQSQRLATIGELTTAIANDLRNPLQGISAAAYYLKTKMSSTADEKTAKMLALIEKDINYSDRIVCQLLEYSGSIWIEFCDTTSQVIVDGALSLVRVPERVQVVNETQSGLKIRVDKQKITAVFVHLIENAVDAMPEGGVLRIESMSLNDDVIFRFSDTGVGMSQELLCKIWNPLFTTKASGMGLSLATCKRIVEAHGGSISVQSTLGKGSTFTVRISAQER